jgi:membrane protease YdiL (CAAX protease family)
MPSRSDSDDPSDDPIATSMDGADNQTAEIGAGPSETGDEPLDSGESPVLLGPRDLLWAAILVEGGLTVAALALAWLLEVDLAGRLRGTAAGWLWGVVGTLPLLLLFHISMRSLWRPLAEIRTFLETALGPALASASHLTLIVIALLAGVCEELLFRGVLQPLLGLVWTSLLFGLLHAVTVPYAVIAAVLGMYLGWQMEATGDLVTPIVTHTLYDWLAFLVLRRRMSRRHSAISTTSADGR